MSYWWYMHRFGSGNDPILLTPTEATEGMAAKQGGESFEIPRLHMQIDTKAISDFEESSRPYALERPALGPGGDMPKRELPKTNSRNSVLVQWVKRLVTERVYQRGYSNRPGYWPLRNAEHEGGLYVVHARPVYADAMPDGLEPLEDWEQQIIEKRLDSQPGWWRL